MLETDRLHLRPWRVSDAAMQHQLWAERDSRVPPHRRLDADGRPTVTELEERGPQGLFVIELSCTGEAIGYCGLIESDHGEPELAFELLRDFWRNGYATEAARAVIVYAQSTGVTRLLAGVREWNIASRRVLAKLGFVETGIVETGIVEVSEPYGNSLLMTIDLESADFVENCSKT